MSIQKNLIYNIQILNKVNIAHLTYLLEKAGIYLNDVKPVCDPTLSMAARIFPFTDTDNIAHCMDSYYGRYYEEFDGDDFNEEMIKLGIKEFFEKYFQEKNIHMADEMIATIKKYSHYDLIFNKMGDYNPFVYTIDEDPETGCCMRTITGRTIVSNTLTVITDVHVLVMERLRKMGDEEDSKIGVVSLMTDEERALYDTKIIVDTEKL